ncbi:hypothetical protein BJY01DRAFT_210179 [Aspergillus pseudoustus]|uniref:Integral membrane protein n=1 Tax=Aspergillus pseudoustus TaxID=1810923 RepID=A0ABR4KD34_9EURO
MVLQAVLLAFEAILAIVCLALAFHAYPDTCRTILWQLGGTEGWNSDPHARVYFYANYREPPPIPRIWSDEITESHLGISATSVVAWMIRVFLRCFQSNSRYSLVLFDAILIALWAVSVYGQLSSDYSDPDHPSRWPWYVVHGCDKLESPERGCCRLARAFLWGSGNLLILYLGRFVWSMYKSCRSGGRGDERGGITSRR